MLLDNIYGIPIQFTADNAGALIQAAQFMLYEGAVNEGKLYLLCSLTVDNSISTFLQAKNLELPEVSALAAELISERFEDTLWTRFEGHLVFVRSEVALSVGCRRDPLHKVGGFPECFFLRLYHKTWTKRPISHYSRGVL